MSRSVVRIVSIPKVNRVEPIRISLCVVLLVVSLELRVEQSALGFVVI
jgi:hypothetical protein